LFFLESVQDAAAKGVRGIGELEQGEGHEFDSEELVIGEEVEEEGALFLVFELLGAGEAIAALLFNRDEFDGSPGEIGRAITASRRWIQFE